MVGPHVPEALARAGFSRRVVRREGSYLIYRLADGSKLVRVSDPEWTALDERFRRQTAPIRRQTYALWFALPFVTFLFGMTAAQVLPFSGLLILAMILLGPLVIYLVYSTRVQRVSSRIEDELRAFPLAAMPITEHTVPQPPRVLEIVALALFGPELLFGLIGEIGGPDIFRNTPWSGSHLGTLELAIASIFAVYVLWRWIATRHVRQ